MEAWKLIRDGKEYDLGSHEWVEYGGSNRLIAHINNLEYYIDLTGKAIDSNKYSILWPFSGGYYCSATRIQDGHIYCIRNINNEVVLDQLIDIIYSHDDIFVCAHASKQYFYFEAAKQKKHGHYLGGNRFVKQRAVVKNQDPILCSIIDESYDPILSNLEVSNFTGLEFSNAGFLAVLKRGGKTCIHDLDGNIVNTFTNRYNVISVIDDCLDMYDRKLQKWGVLSVHGDVVFPFVYDASSHLGHGVFALTQGKNVSLFQSTKLIASMKKDYSFLKCVGNELLCNYKKQYFVSTVSNPTQFIYGPYEYANLLPNGSFLFSVS